MVKICINGFGRIGRAILKINESHNYFKIVAINDIDKDLKNILYLLKHDSTYGTYENEVNYIDQSSFSIGGNLIRYSSENYIENIDCKDIDLIIDSSGIKNNIVGSRNLINKGLIKKVVITHASDLVDNTIIMGVNEDKYDHIKDNLVSASICDANAVAQALRHVDDNWGIKNCFFSTLHPWLSYQNLLDGSLKSISSPGHYWRDYALGRASLNSLIPKPTTAADAVLTVLPNLKNKIDAISFRTPTSIVSSSDITITCKNELETDEVKKYFKKAAEKSPYMQYNKDSLVSIDYKKNDHSSIIDGQWIKVLDKNVLKIVVWYDNEWGYSARALDVARLLVGIL